MTRTTLGGLNGLYEDGYWQGYFHLRAQVRNFLVLWSTTHWHGKITYMEIQILRDWSQVWQRELVSSRNSGNTSLHTGSLRLPLDCSPVKFATVLTCGEVFGTARQPNQRVNFKLSLARGSFFYQSSRIWTALPESTRQCQNLYGFKKECKKWVSLNIKINPLFC